MAGGRKLGPCQALRSDCRAACIFTGSMGLPFAKDAHVSFVEINPASPKTPSRVEDVLVRHAGSQLILHRGIPISQILPCSKGGAVALA